MQRQEDGAISRDVGLGSEHQADNVDEQPSPSPLSTRTSAPSTRTTGETGSPARTQVDGERPGHAPGAATPSTRPTPDRTMLGSVP